MKALFLNALSTDPQIDVAMPMSSSEVMFWKSTFHKYVYIQKHIYMCEKLFSTRSIFELGIGIASSFYGMVLNAFLEKNSSNRTHLSGGEKGSSNPRESNQCILVTS